MPALDNFYDIPLYEENNEKHNFSVKVTLEGDKMEVVYDDMIWETMESIVEDVVFDAKAVRELYHDATNQDLIARLVISYMGPTAYDALLNYLHEHGIQKQ